MKATVASIDYINSLVMVVFNNYEHNDVRNDDYLIDTYKLPSEVTALYVESFPYDVGDVVDDAPFNSELYGTDYSNSIIYYGETEQVSHQRIDMLNYLLMNNESVINQIGDMYSDAEIFNCVLFMMWNNTDNTSMLCTDIMPDYIQDVVERNNEKYPKQFKPNKELVFFL